MATRRKSGRYLAGIDVGGTFTDLVLVEDSGRTIIQKVPSVPGDIAAGVLAAIATAEDAIKPDKPLIQSLDRLVHGSTVAANSFLERKGANMGFITTKGFKDTLVMRRMYRENMYDTRSAPVTPLVRRDNIFEIEERIDKNGRVVTPLNKDDLDRVIDEIARRGLESVGVCFLFSFRNPAHESAVKRAFKKRLRGIHLSLSCEVCPEIRDYERASTTHLNAYLQPPVSDYLKKLDSKLRGPCGRRQRQCVLGKDHRKPGRDRIRYGRHELRCQPDSRCNAQPVISCEYLLNPQQIRRLRRSDSVHRHPHHWIRGRLGGLV